MKFLKVAVLYGIIVLLTGCISSLNIKKVESDKPISIEEGEKTKPIKFKKVVIKIPRNTVVGTIQWGLGCPGRKKILWYKGGKVNITNEDLTDLFREELIKYNYDVVGNPNALFEDPSEGRAELIIAALVKDMKGNICFDQDFWGNLTPDAEGEAFFQVEWQIYSLLERKVIYVKETEGYFAREDKEEDGGRGIWLGAFAVAVNNLISDSKFNELVKANKDISRKNYFHTLTLYAKNYEELEIPKDTEKIRSAVVTIRAGEKYGSGFIISPDGYILTNHHVVSGAKFLKIILSTGREIIGEPIRSDTRRDVALVKIAEKNMPYLLLAHKDSRVGSDVYAIGSPRHQDLNATISRGIISAYRDDKGFKYLQSDVNVQPGSSGGPLVLKNGKVIGITEKGLSEGRVLVGLNFFIPIADAIQALDIYIKN